MRIGILGWGFVEWAGGVDFLNIVIGSILATEQGQRAEIILLVPSAGLRARAQRVLAHSKALIKSAIYRRFLVSSTTMGAAHLQSAVQDLGIEIVRIAPGRRALRAAATKYQLDVLLPAVFTLGTGFPKPWIGYIFDCQHRHLTQHFRERDRRNRDEAFQELLSDANAVIVNSRAVKSDLDTFYPGHGGTVFSMPFAPAPRTEWLAEQTGTLEKYFVGQPYFLISNQFWIHKDHATAFTAFEKVASRNTAVSLVCTGGTYDSRDPAHFPRLVDQIKAAGLQHRVKILGVLPKRDQIELLKRAQAVVQPTLFEGGPGGGAVYDAIALGVPAIVSDIPVNREIEGGSVSFFRAGCAEELAAQMLLSLSTNATAARIGDLVSAGHARRRHCGAVIMDAIDRACGQTAK